MALFQQSVLKKHIESLNTATIDEKWKLFKSHFHNTVIQQNIRQLKEEQYQGEFLEDLFVKIFGYTKAPSPNFNIITEQKNITNSKKADGAIIVNEKALAVIELKGTDTTDLAKIESQAFGYKSNQPGCNYVITSNFEKLRFYIDNTTQFEEFNLFTLDKPSFELLYCCLDWESISKNTPVNLLNQSVSKENAITKHLYRDYSEFKRNLFDNLVELNPQFDKLELFKKTQKLLDRFLFIFFAEDRLLLPTNLIRRINQEWENLQKMRIPVSLYDRYKIYFNDLNEGARVTLPAFGKKTGEAIEETLDIFAYNGGLFKPDDFLDNLKIDDQLLYTYTLKLSDYDFQSEVDVNILGHIFENSLNEIDEIKSEIEGKEVDKTKTKRKKDGVFYTPKYITKYIVDNTVGKLCKEKKTEIKLVEEEYHTDKNLQTKTKKALLDKLTSYREWLLQLTICDPACGSGAFLNQALEFLIAEHRYIDELQAKLMGDSMVLSDVETSILENNIYGVDLNDESIEIAKLSLWLRTAQKGRKLNSLNNNIKCGNSLIDAPEVAGEKAFSWEKEFPEVFAKGGFDVIIGNPPYGVNFTEIEKKYLTNFDSLVPDYEIYIYFISLYRKILKPNSVLSYIFPNTFLSTLFGKKYRDEIFNKVDVYEIIDLSQDNTFTDANVRTCIFSFINKSSNYESKLFKVENSSFNFVNSIDKKDIIKETENLLSLFSQKKEEKIIIKKIQKQQKLNHFFSVSQGYIPYRRSDLIKNFGEEKGNEIVDKRLWHSNEKKTEEWLGEILGKNVKRYIYSNSDSYFYYGKHVASYVDIKFFNQQRILIREITGDKLFCSLVEDTLINNPSLINIINEKNLINLKYALAILNSSLIGWLHNKISPKAAKGLFPKILINDVRNIPIADAKVQQQNILIKSVDLIINLSNNFQKITDKFNNYFTNQYHLEKLPNKLEKWYELSFVDFIKELNKAIKTVKGTLLSKKDEFEWMELFEDNKKKALELKAEIDKTDKEIDQMVYELYGLTEEEIKIVEGV